MGLRSKVSLNLRGGLESLDGCKDDCEDIKRSGDDDVYGGNSDDVYGGNSDDVYGSNSDDGLWQRSGGDYYSNHHAPVLPIAQSQWAFLYISYLNSFQNDDGNCINFQYRN